MTNFVPPIQLDIRNFDPTGRLRVSQPQTLFESSNEYMINPYMWVQSTTGVGASVTHLINENGCRLRVGTVSGETAIHQTKRYFRHQANKSQLIAVTATLGAAKANVRQRIGFFDGYNGMFFEQTSTGLYVVVRSYTSGSAVDTAVLQTSWNIDALNGTGKSRINIDTSKNNIFIIDFRYFGEVRFGLMFDGRVYYCHQTKYINNLTTMYISSANLPIRAEISNTGTSASQTDLVKFLCSVTCEGRTPDEVGTLFTAHNTAVRATSVTRLPLLSIRAKNVFQNKPNRALIELQGFNVMATTETILYEIIYNGVLTDSSWVSVNTNSVVEYDVSATAINDGYASCIYSGICVATAGGAGGANPTIQSTDISATTSLTIDINGFNNDIISLCATTYANTGTAAGTLNWREFY
jgi:hypothetical protein